MLIVIYIIFTLVEEKAYAKVRNVFLRQQFDFFFNGKIEQLIN